MYRNLFILLLLVVTSCGYRSEIQSEQATQLFHDGLEAYYLGDAATAQSFFERTVKADGKNAAAYYYLSTLALLQQENKQADAYLQKALTIEPTNFWYRIQEAKIASLNGNAAKAQQCYEDLWAQYPQKTMLLYDMINLYVNSKNPKRALEILDILEEKEGKTEQSVLMRFNLMLEDNPQEAYAQLEAYTLQNPGARTLSIMGDYAAQRGQVDSALVAYQSALAIDPLFMPAVFGEAEAYRMRRQFDMFFERINPFLASPDIDAAMKRDYMKQLMESRGFVATFTPQVDTMFLSVRQAHPTDSTLAYMYTGYLIQTDRSDQAKDVIMENVSHYPTDHGAWMQALAVFYYQEDWARLEDCAQKAMDVFANDFDIQSMYGLALSQEKKVPEAIACFEGLLSTLPKKDDDRQIQTNALLGDLYHQAGDNTKAFAAYEEVLRRDPENVGILNNYAYFLCLENRELEKALAMSKKTIEAEPNNATYLDTYGWILHLLDRNAEAKDVFRQAMAYGGKESAEVLNHYGDVLNALNEPLMAIVYWQQAYALEPREDINQKIKKNKNL